LLSQNAASACPPTSLLISTIKAASLFAAGQSAGAISAKVAALTEGVLKTMLLAKIKIVTAAILVGAGLVPGIALMLTQANGPEPEARSLQQGSSETAEAKRWQQSVPDNQANRAEKARQARVRNMNNLRQLALV